MDLPPSGWYPDPYGVPALLRWWDGSAWTQHTHQDAGPAAADGAEGAGPAATTEQPAVQQPGLPPTAPQPVVGAPPAPVTVQPTTGQPTTGQPTTGQPTTGQPAMPPTTIQPTVQPTTVQPTTAQPTTAQPTTMQPTAAQPGSLQPAATRVGGAGPMGAAGAAGRPALPAAGGLPDAGANGTQVLFLGDDAWANPNVPGAPGGAGDLYGYQRAQRRRRMWLASALAVGTVAALAVIALVVNALAQTSAPPVAATRPSPPAAPTSPVAAATSPSATATAAGSTLTDGQSGLSYTQLPTPWQPSCPGGLNQGFAWTAGESAVAGQVNGGQTTWYGTACSGPLPQQYGYNGVADLDNVATQLANQFNGTYYSGLNHNFQQEVSQPLQVSGHAGWEVKFLITYTNAQAQGLSWNDELGAVVVADSGDGSAPAVFYTSIPGNLGENNVDTLVSSLQLTAVTPQQGGSPDPGGSPAT